MIIVILSILLITLAVWGINKKLPIQICSICAGVSLTWLWMIFGMGFGLLPVSEYEFLTAILMGASIGGIVTELKKMFLKLRNKEKNTEVEKIKKQLDDCC
ncbi:MAG: hypothetical protein AAB815_02645 [Patescibacteria group bacterium]